MIFGSICSGIEAASVAWHPLGWRCAFVAEIDPFACAVLAHHYPEVPNLGDVTALDGRPWRGKVDVLVAGTPCQAFSVAGLRQSLDDERGNLSLVFVRIVHAIDPRFVVWENVPGVLSTKDNAFACFLAGLVGASSPLVPARGQRWTDAGLVAGPQRTAAWRVLDAQYFQLAQRRRRVFVVSCRTRDGINPGAILFEPESVPQHSPPRREAGQGTATSVIKGAAIGRKPGAGPQRGEILTDGTCYTLNTTEEHAVLADTLTSAYAKTTDTAGSHGSGPKNLVYQCQGTNVGEMGSLRAGNGNVTGGVPFTVGPLMARATPNGHGSAGANDQDVYAGHVLPVAFDTTQITHPANHSSPKPGDPCHPLGAYQHPPAVAFSVKDNGQDAGDIAPTLRAMEFDGSHANGGGQVGVVAFQEDNQNGVREYDTTGSIRSDAPGTQPAGTLLRAGMVVRRLLPTECEALMGFPRNYTLVPYRGKLAADGPRYRSLGNSFAVPVVRWIGQRIQMVEELG